MSGAGQGTPVAHATGGCGCGTCSTCASASAPTRSTGLVYAIGRLQPRFPTLSVEKEFAQAVGRSETADLTDRELLVRVLANDGLYLLRHLCWVLTVADTDAYMVDAHDSLATALIAQTLRDFPRSTDLDVVIGSVGAPDPTHPCAALGLPAVRLAQVYSFDRASLIESLPEPKDGKADRFALSVEELLDRVLHLADNMGFASHHRAINYLVTRYPALYHEVARRHAAEQTLASVQMQPSSIAGPRTVVEVIMSFRHRRTDVEERMFTRVDVTEIFPFLVSKLAHYYGH